MKNLTCFLLTLLLLVSLATPVALAAESGFADVPTGAWFAEAVDWAVNAQITQGTGADTFSPDEGCTRAQIVTFLYRASGEAEPPAPASSAFSDVAPEAYYAGPIAWAVAKGVTVGTGETTFSPNDTCTRAQIVTFLFRAAGSPAASAYDGSFSDVAASAYYAQAVQWAVAQGITKGTGEGQFSPDKTCTLAEAVTFLMRCAQAAPTQPTEPTRKHVLVVYFSATGNTRPLAQTVAALLDADLYEITAALPYTAADLAYYTNGRADKEQADPACRPAIGSPDVDLTQYDTIVIGHPIWHGQALRIICTFLEHYDFAGKTLTTFCTSHSSPLGTSAETLKGLLGEDVTWLPSRRFAAGTGEGPLAAWLTEIGLLAK